MDRSRVLSAVDHTLLAPTATWAEIKALCDDAVAFGVASVCVPPSHVAQAKDYVGDKMAVGTTIGFPNGYSTTAIKCFETVDAVKNGVDELDMVINLGWVKEGDYEAILDEIRQVKLVCGSRVLKVIIEACLLTEEEKVELCRVVSESGAEYIKTSTGFSTGGATREDVALLRKHVAPHVKVKAAGGISSFEDAEALLELGAERLGTSRLVKLMKSEQK